MSLIANCCDSFSNSEEAEAEQHPEATNKDDDKPRKGINQEYNQHQASSDLVSGFTNFCIFLVTFSTRTTKLTF